MTKKYKYSIGDWVTFKKFYKVHSDSGERYAHEIGLIKPILGQVCGAVIRYLGKIKTNEYDYHNEYAFLVPEKSITLYQIKTGMINVAHEVKEEDIEAVGFTDVDLKLPWKKSWASKRYKEEMSEAANDRLRNAQGHFI
jgi:hypothetical protein